MRTLRWNSQVATWLLLSFVLVFAFQNCMESNLRSAFYKTSEASRIEVDPFVQTNVTSSEMVPLEVVLKDGSYELESDSTPRGATYDPVSSTLSWLPQKGQRGQYELTFRRTSDQMKQILTLSIEEVAEDVLLKGPPTLYRDGDIGYVFLHGAGEVDRCVDRTELAAYWGASVDIIAPDTLNRFVACYDGRHAVADAGPSVAQQILQAPCGRFNKCIVITHSMGGLMMEHMFTHTRESRDTDLEPEMFDNRALYQQVKDRTLMVISLGSAAGGSKVANILEDPSGYNLSQAVTAYLAPILARGPNNATRNLRVLYASNVVAPYNEDPGVPFFMIPGYSAQLMTEDDGFLEGLFDQFFGLDDALKIFNGSIELGFLDRITVFKSRSDGLVDFRSACGVASDNEADGPGYSGTLDRHFDYCLKAPKKANHYVWFASNSNHFLLSAPWDQCNNDENPCKHHFPNHVVGAFETAPQFDRMSPMHVMRLLLGQDSGGMELASNSEGQLPASFAARTGQRRIK